ncbi:MAG: hypothetical protein J6038_03300 [Bacilli bacterium]|nr:hypothetical protein [Bacilli bacterium]
MKVPLKKTEKWLAENFKTLGFEIYDYLHLASALTMVVLLLVYWAQLNQVHAEVTLFKEVAFFCMSALLILFVAFIAENEDPHSERLVYNFCWLIASLILFIPALFDLIIFFVEGRDIYSRSSLFVSDLASMLFPILSLAFFMIAILRLKRIKHWLHLMFFGIVLFLLGTVADMIQLII